MNISIDYVKGVVETTLDFFEENNNCIDKNKELTINYEPFWNSGKSMIIGCKITFTCRTMVSNKWDIGHEFYENYITVLSGERLTHFISDVSSELETINNLRIII